jgi:hypothetical protein
MGKINRIELGPSQFQERLQRLGSFSRCFCHTVGGYGVLARWESPGNKTDFNGVIPGSSLASDVI